jgi:hypothetical protein
MSENLATGLGVGAIIFSMMIGLALIIWASKK